MIGVSHMDDLADADRSSATSCSSTVVRGAAEDSASRRTTAATHSWLGYYDFLFNIWTRLSDRSFDES